ncbi:MAG: Gfo/Idh/MocA family oxidoreductase [Planctomycetota bacterium]|nr:MAG: Gfo/Idh/MocA family oxidoreductase [Planctomycetota bacterium]
MSLRVGMIACGGIARHHWRGWSQVADRAEVVALVDVSAENRAWFKQHVPKATEYDDYNGMLAKEKLDAVDISLPHHLHHPCLMSVIKKGLHWICEKPLCMSLDEAADIDQAMSGSKLVGMSAHNQAFFPALLEAKRLISEGQLGEIYTIISEDCFIMGLPRPGALPGEAPWSAVEPGMWRADAAKMGGGELIDTGYHPTYRLLFLAGREPVRVAAITGKYRQKHMQAEDTATVLIEFDNGITGMVRTSWALELPAGHHSFHVVAERGELYGSANELCWKPVRFNEPAKMAFDEVDTFEKEIVHFVDCVEQGIEPLQSYKDGIRVLQVIRKSYDFVDEGKANI